MDRKLAIDETNLQDVLRTRLSYTNLTVPWQTPCSFPVTMSPAWARMTHWRLLPHTPPDLSGPPPHESPFPRAHIIQQPQWSKTTP